MAESTNIFRKQSDDEKSDFQDISSPKKKTFTERFIGKLRKVEKEYNEKFLPFCYTCAKNDFEDELQRISTEVGRSDTHPVFAKKIIEKIENFPFDNYGDKGFFTLMDVHERTTLVVEQGLKRPQKTHAEYNWVCNKRGHKRTINMPWYYYEEHFLNKNRDPKDVYKKEKKTKDDSNENPQV